MKNRKRFLACMLATALCVSNFAVPDNRVYAMEEAMEKMTEEEIEEAAAVADGVEIVELPKEDGDYVVYMGSDVADEISIENEVQEIAETVPEVIVETDLSAEQVKELEMQDNMLDEIYVEENFYLEGASDDDFDPEIDCFDVDNSFLKDMDSMEIHNWKKVWWKKERKKRSRNGIYRWYTRMERQKRMITSR